MNRDYGEGNRTIGFRPLRAAAGVGPSAEARKLFNEQAGMQASYLEGSIFDQLFHHLEGHSLSAVQALIEANREQIPIQRITAANIDTVLPGLAVGSEVKDDVSNATQAGKISLVPQREITHGSWTGSGYILHYPATGAAAYKLGSANGGTEQPCQARLTPQQAQEIMTRLAGMLDGLINGWISGPGAAWEAVFMGELAANTHELHLLRLSSVWFLLKSKTTK